MGCFPELRDSPADRIRLDRAVALGNTVVRKQESNKAARSVSGTSAIAGKRVSGPSSYTNTGNASWARSRTQSAPMER